MIKNNVGMIVGQNVRALRKAKKWTQTQLANKVGIHLRYLQKIEIDGVNVSFAVFYQMKKAFGCDWKDLFKGVP
ncbi:MAG: helix-turn-helix transcriptional regulator [Verrucomicrobiae bacterium]|nr:helix-turn-helix transcriptional regulator [Verrucomicrobiae bacterium]